MATTLSTKIEIDGESFELGAIPGADCKLVKTAKASVLKNLDLDKLIGSLERSADLLFLAYNGVAGFGELRAATNELQDDLSKLCTKTELAIDKFRIQTGAILDNLSSTFEWLTQGEEDVALDFLAGAAILADKMADEAGGLAQGFDELADKTRKVCSQTEIQQGKTDEERRKLQQQLTDLQATSAAAKKEAEALGELKAKMQELYDEAKQKAETAENRAFALAITSAIFTPIAAGIGAFAGAYTASQTRTPVPPALPKNPPKSQEQEDEEKAKKELDDAKKEQGQADTKLEKAKTEESEAQKSLNEKAAEVEVKQKKLTEAKKNRDNAKDPSEEEKKKLAKAVENAEAELNHANDAQKEAQKELNKKTTARTDAETAASKKKDNAELKKAAWGAAAKALQGAAQKIDEAGKSYLDLAQQYENTRKDYLNKWLDFKKQEAQKLGEIEKYAVQMSAVTTSADIQKTVSESLVQAVKAFNEVSQILRIAAQFWHQMSSACAQLGSDSKLQQDLKIYKDKLTLEKRLQAYERTAFKTMVVQYMASWKALEIVCGEYGKATAKTRSKIQGNIVKSPSPEESIKFTAVLAKSLIATAMEAQEGTNQDINEIEKAVKAA